MKRKLLVAAIAATMLAPVVAQAADVTVGGRVRVDFSKLSGDGAEGMEDLLINENKARVRLQASEQTEGGTKVIAQLEVEFADNHGKQTNAVDVDADTGEETVSSTGPDLRSARILLINDMGTFVLAGDTPSGQWADLYGHLDIFHGTGPGDTDDLYDQSAESGNLIAYANKFGAVKFVGALAAPNRDSEEEFDVMAVRAIWADGPLSIGGGYTSFVDNRDIMALMASFDAGAAKFGVTAESVSADADEADSTTIGLSVAAPMDKITLKAAVVSVSADDESHFAVDSAQRMIIGADYAMAPGVTAYGNFTSNNEEAGDYSMINTGVNFTF